MEDFFNRTWQYLNINRIVGVNSLDVIARSKDVICEIVPAIWQKNPEKKEFIWFYLNGPKK